RRPLLFLLLRRKIRAMAFEHLRRHTDRLAESRMRMNGLADICRLAAHLDREADFTDQVAGMRPDDSAADDPMGRRVEQQLGKTLIAAVGDGAAGCGPREDGLAELDALRLALLLRLARPGDFRISVGDRRNLPRVEK